MIHNILSHIPTLPASLICYDGDGAGGTTYNEKTGESETGLPSRKKSAKRSVTKTAKKKSRPYGGVGAKKSKTKSKRR